MPLQRSFSDQNHSSKQRSQWRRNRSYPRLQTATANASSKILQEKPPVPVSSATKNKLSKFHLDRLLDTDAMAKPMVTFPSNNDDKENAVMGEGQVIEDAVEDENASSHINSAPTGSARKEVPSTPAGRVALPDLIGMGDVRRAVQNISPDERIMWDHNKDAGSASFGETRQGKKRARSSSPSSSSSPAQNPSLFRANGESMEFQRLNHQVDPGFELWGRYTFTSSNKPTLQGPTMPTLEHIMHTSSPQPHKETITPRSAAVFRRAISCGNQFPKRRRVGVLEGAGDDVFSESVYAGPSRLSVLIEKVQEGLTQHKPPDFTSGPSSSSPIPGKGHFLLSRPCSPIGTHEDSVQTIAKQITYDQNSCEQPRLVKDNRECIEPAHDQVPNSSSSDYGDFDDAEFDETIINAIESKPGLLDSKASELQVLKSPSKLFDQRSPPGVETQCKPSQDVNKSFESNTLKAEDDEFGDSDEDLLAVANLEHIVSHYDRQIPAEKKASPAIEKATCSIQCQGLVASKTDSEDDYGDDFDDLDFEVAEAAEAAATQSMQQPPNNLLYSTQKARTIQRYLVTSILDNDYDADDRKYREKILLLEIENTSSVKLVHLRGAWLDTPITTKAFVHVLGNFGADGRCIIDDFHNLLILHPDHLISSTVVADSFSCTRRAVLQDKVKATSNSSAPLVYGTILHEIFQAAMLANRWDTEWLKQLIQSAARRHIEDLYTIKLQVPHAVEYLQSKMGELQSWAELFVSSQPKSQAIVQAGNGKTATMCVSKLLDVEEHVWSPMYGLKGNIDATVQVTMKDGKDKRTLTVPFEVKTGKNANASHRAQTALYNLLLSDRYDVEIAYGILYYMETSETIRIPAIRHELRHMIMQRNELACFVRERHTQLPPMLKRESLCNRCYAKTPCFIYHKLVDDGDGETSGMKDKFEVVVKHLTTKHKEFFLKWDDLLTKEEKESLKFRRELWTMLSSEREKLGRCFSNVVIEPGSAYEEQSNPKINRYRYTLVKQAPTHDFSFLESQITVGEPIVISDENGHFALGNGYVTHVRKKRITVAVDRRLHNARIRRPGFDETSNQVFTSIMEVEPEGSTSKESKEKTAEEPVLYRLDKDEFSNGMATVRNNLIQVMADGPFGSREIRSLVVDLAAPKFKPHSTAYTLADRANINVDQRRAIEKVMSAQDYALVLGMPGTGKTTTIAHIIRALASQGKSVLLTSYTHTAVDNILLKLRYDNIPILRLGATAKINTDVQEFALLAGKLKSTFEEIRSAWHDTPIVATTCLGINHAIFNERTFDYCIVDEASQITLPVCLGPIRLAQTFILVGDHNQLPPLVQNGEARTGGLDISLFKLLSDTHPSSVVYLEHQYRMCEDVMALSNNLIYNGRLKCGSREVANGRIEIPNMDALMHHHHTPLTISHSQKSFCVGPIRGRCWLRDLLDPEIKVAFINTDTLLPRSREEAKGNRIVNPTEAAICVQLVESLLTVGVPASTIGVMTHYRSQLALLKHGLHSHNDVEMHTADRFQGRDKEVVVLSLVRSNEARSIGELLKDWRRINVAFTRAKTKLLVIGSRDTLKGSGSEEMVARFVSLMEQKGWIYDLPNGAAESHIFDETVTQATVGVSSGPGGTQWKSLEAGEEKKHATRIKEPGTKLQPKRVQAGERALLSRRPVLRDIFNDSIGK